MTNLILSIITINFNNCNGLLKTIKSINYQKNKNFEYIIIDNESNDGSVQYILDFKHSNYKYLIEKDSGIYNAFNKGLKLSNGKFILFLNSGDELINDEIIDIIINNSDNDQFLNIFGLNLIKFHNVVTSFVTPKK